MVHLILPPLRRTSADAAQFATAIHVGDAGAAGAALIAHLTRVASNVARLVEGCPFWTSDHRDDAVIIAWLHHVIVDGGITTRDLRREGFSRIVIDDVEALTNDRTADHGDWIDSVVQDADLSTILVMLADTHDTGCCQSDWAALGNEAPVHAVNGVALKSKLSEAARSKGWEGDLSFLSPSQ